VRRNVRQIMNIEYYATFLLVVCLVSSGCGTHRVKTYGGRLGHSVDLANHKLTVRIEPHSKQTHIPFIMWRIHDSAPYTLHIATASRAPETNSLCISTLTLSTSDENALDLLSGQPVNIDFRSRNYFTSGSGGIQTNTVYESKWSSNELNLDYVPHSTCTVYVGASVGKSTIQTNFHFKAREKTKRGSVVSWYSDI